MQMLLISPAMLCILNQERRRRKMQVKLLKKSFFPPLRRLKDEDAWEV